MMMGIVGGDRTSAAGGYVGPGDMATYLAWYGLRGYTAAYTGHAIDIEDSGSANAATIDIVNHALDLTTLNAWIALHGTASVTRIYDQTGGGNELTSTNFTQSPIISIGATGLKSGYPSLVFVSASGTSLHHTLGTTVNQPYSLSAFLYSTNAAGGYFGSTTNFSGGFVGNGTAGLYGGTSIFETAADDTWHALNSLASGAASYIYVDTTPGSPQDTGTGNITSGHELSMGRVFNNFDGKFCEAGIIASDQRSNFLTLAANQRAYWLP